MIVQTMILIGITASAVAKSQENTIYVGRIMRSQSTVKWVMTIAIMLTVVRAEPRLDVHVEIQEVPQ